MFLDTRLHEEIQRSRRGKKPLSLIMLDLDHFKRLNDTHGHRPATKLLKMTTRALRQCWRTSDVMARFGGEEFVVIAPETDSDGRVNLG